jgi:phenylalanyl-tRNA synthetase alpha subunit
MERIKRNNKIDIIDYKYKPKINNRDRFSEKYLKYYNDFRTNNDIYEHLVTMLISKISQTRKLKLKDKKRRKRQKSINNKHKKIIEHEILEEDKEIQEIFKEINEKLELFNHELSEENGNVEGEIIVYQPNEMEEIIVYKPDIINDKIEGEIIVYQPNN